MAMTDTNRRKKYVPFAWHDEVHGHDPNEWILVLSFHLMLGFLLAFLAFLAWRTFS